MARKTLEASSAFFVLFFLLSGTAEGREILVGGKPNVWKIPSSPSDSLNKWAENTRFHVDDTLVWKYDSNKDSVLQVTKEAYLSCNATNPVAEHKDGLTKVKFDRAGPFFFISGSNSNCEEGQKLIVVVMSPRSSHSLSAAAPAPSPAEFLQAPAVAPTSAAVSSASLRGEFFMIVLIAVGLGPVFL